MPDDFLPGMLRRIRRTADLSQRELAGRLGVSKSAVAAAENGTRGLDARTLWRAAQLAGLRLTLFDGQGTEVTGMADGAVRDMGGRRFPAHLDTRHSDEDWWHGNERYSRRQPWYTFDRDRSLRDEWRRRLGTPDDHQLPRAGDSPRDRAQRRRAEARQRRREEWERRQAAGELRLEELWSCTCPPGCDELDDREGRPVHAAECGCQCDLA